MSLIFLGVPYVDIVGVTGSIPVAPTTGPRGNQCFRHVSPDRGYGALRRTTQKHVGRLARFCNGDARLLYRDHMPRARVGAAASRTSDTPAELRCLHRSDTASEPPLKQSPEPDLADLRLPVVGAIHKSDGRLDDASVALRAKLAEPNSVKPSDDFPLF